MGNLMGGQVRFLELVRPVMCVLPEVQQPDRKVPFAEGAVDNHHALHFLVCRQHLWVFGQRSRPIHSTDACDSGFKSRHTHGTWH